MMLLVEETQGVLFLTLNRPKRMNSLNIELLDNLLNVLQSKREIKYKYIVLKGNGPSFCVGADLRELYNSKNIVDYLDALVGKLNEIIYILETEKVPTISLIQGDVVGGGFSLCLATKYRIIIGKARFKVGPGLLGLIPAGGCTFSLQRFIGNSLARRILLWNYAVTSEEALHWGIIDSILLEDVNLKDNHNIIENLSSLLAF